jgi:putative ABC transport system ATP-binding protein
VIEVSNLSVLFSVGTPLQATALSNLSLSIGEGEFVTVIGSNGAGKSTLLNSLSGEVRASEGVIRIDCSDVTSLPTHLRANSIARIFQDPMCGTCQSLTVEENMALAMRRGRRRLLGPALSSSMRAKFREHLSTLGLGLERRLTDSIGLLSGGQRQAVSLLMATLSPSRVLLLDEHTAALDPTASDLVLKLTNRFVGELGLTTLMVTHSMRQALEYGTRLVMMHQGRIVYDARGEEKARLSISDLLNLFGDMKGGIAESDRMLLA